MKFEINNKQLLDVYKLMKGFVAKTETRPILNAVHIICDEENQTTLFESTNASKIARWVLNTKVIEKGECSLLFSKTFLYLLKATKSPIPFDVIIYDEDGVFKANINGNIIILEARKGDYPKTNQIFDDPIEIYDNEPIFSIAVLEEALKAMREAGADTVTMGIPKKEASKVRMTCKPFGSERPIVSVMTTLRQWH